MKSKRIITTVLTLCFVALALAGIASARDIGPFNRQLLTGRSHLYSTTRERYYSNRTKAVANVSSFTNLGNNIDGVGDAPNRGTTTYGVKWKVYYNSAYTEYHDVDVTIYKKAVQGTRSLSSYTDYVNTTGDGYKLELWNDNNFAIQVAGTWCPDCKSTD